GSLGALKIFPDLNLGGTFLGIWLAHTAFGLPLAVYLLRNYIGSLPSEIIESAKMDGADHFTIFWRLIIPLSVPALAAFAIFQFLWVWNDLLVALVFLGGTPENRVLTIALQQLVGARGENWELLTAASFISMSLPLIVFFSLQRYFVRGLTAGSVKGWAARGRWSRCRPSGSGRRSRSPPCCWCPRFGPCWPASSPSRAVSRMAQRPILRPRTP